METCDLREPASFGGDLSPCVYRTSNSYTVRLAGGRVIRRGASGSVLAAIVAGGPLNALPGPAGAGAAPGGAVTWKTRRGPAGLTPRRLSSHSWGVSVGLTTEIAILLRSARSAAKTSSG